MQKLERRDIKDIIEYEKIRDVVQRAIIHLKRHRRVSVGRLLTFTFENRETVLFQIEEMMRVERIVLEERIQDEIDVYNALIPEKNQLSATLLIQVTDKRRIKATMDRFMGIDHGVTTWFQLGDIRVYGEYESGHSNEEKLSAVHFVRFTFTSQQSHLFCSGKDAAYLVVEHRDYIRRTRVDDDVRRSLAADLEG